MEGGSKQTSGALPFLSTGHEKSLPQPRKSMAVRFTEPDRFRICTNYYYRRHFIFIGEHFVCGFYSQVIYEIKMPNQVIQIPKTFINTAVIYKFRILDSG